MKVACMKEHAYLGKKNVHGFSHILRLESEMVNKSHAKHKEGGAFQLQILQRKENKSLRDPSFPSCFWRWAIGSLGYPFYHGCRCFLVILGVQIQKCSPGRCPSNRWPTKKVLCNEITQKKMTHWALLLHTTWLSTNSKWCFWTKWAFLELHSWISSPSHNLFSTILAAFKALFQNI